MPPSLPPARPETERLDGSVVGPGAGARLQLAWERRGWLAAALWPVSLLMRLGVAVRRLLYRYRLLRSSRLPVPFVVVGNLVAGGAGKTPTVLALVALLRTLGHRPGIVSRGYGRQGAAVQAVSADTPAAEVGDEPLLLHLRTGVPVWVGRDRGGTARALLAQHPDISVLVADDGLQHLALERDLQLVVFDERGAGNGWLLPAGPLREPLPAGAAWPGRVPTQVIYNAAAPTTPLIGTLLVSRIVGAIRLERWWQGDAAGPSAMAALAALRGRPVLAAAGTARPQRFFRLLRAHGLEIVELPLPDHHPYTTLPWPDDTPDVLVTEKDAIKLTPARLAGCTSRIWVLPLDSRLDAALTPWLLQHLSEPPAPAPVIPAHANGHTTA